MKSVYIIAIFITFSIILKSQTILDYERTKLHGYLSRKFPGIPGLGVMMQQKIILCPSYFITSTMIIIWSEFVPTAGLNWDLLHILCLIQSRTGAGICFHPTI